MKLSFVAARDSAIAAAIGLWSKVQTPIPG
jgi:hypothetical protein